MSMSPDNWDLDGNSKSGSEENFNVEENEDNARPPSKHSIPSCNSDSPTIGNKNSPGTENKRKKRSKKVYAWHRITINKNLLNSKKNGGSPESNGKKKLNVNIMNFPTNWSQHEVHEFIKKEYKPVDFFFISGDQDMCFTGTVKLELDDPAEFPEVFQSFHKKIIDDIKLFVNISGSDNESDKSDSESSSSSQAPRRKRQRPENEKPWRPDIDVWEPDPTGLYGLKPDFLELLGITPPIDKWVHVSNFRCDKAELKEVMELAGQVLACTVDTRGQKFAKVMYSHPLEAVQAVSMLNNQNFYGMDLKVEITDAPVGHLPKGLKGVGPGLGVEGKPLRDIVKQYERFVQSKSSLVNYTVFRSPDLLFDPAYSFAHEQKPFPNDYGNNMRLVPINSLSEPGPRQRRSMESFAASTPVQSAPRNVASQIKVHPTGSMSRSSVPSAGSFLLSSTHGPGPMSGPSGPLPRPCGPMHVPSGPMHGHPGPVNGPAGPMHGSSGPILGPSGPMPGPSGSMHGPPMPSGPIAGPSGPICAPNTFNSIGPGGPGYNAPTNGPTQPGGSLHSSVTRSSEEYSTVELVNLPLSTTFPLLCEKMAECGQVMSLQLTSPGCAVVQFAQPAQARRCYQQYNACRVLGNLIEVKFL